MIQQISFSNDFLLQYILRSTVANPTPLSNVAFHWLTSEYMQLASCFMQLAAAAHWPNRVHFHCLSLSFLRENVNSVTIFKIFIWRGIWSNIRSGIMFYSSAYASP